MAPDLVIFDCDGVLVDSEPAALDVLTANLRRHGLDLSHDAAERLFVGGTMAGAGDAARARGADLPDDWIDGIYAEIYDRLRQGVALVPGVVALLDRLERAGIPTCVGSNGAEEKMAITLAPSGLLDRFAGRIYSAHTLGVAKPDPGLFLAAARAFGAAPDRTTVIDDSPTGARAARAAGMACIGFAARTDPARLIAEGATVARDMEQVARMLDLPPA
ncbi:HAD family hydrolase [Mesobaculum littorinae]|uniref:phosphoglycolate phosphatase n=1 Tax=Mesobaculum littorinae TaxID=2486419 RepID=A0A438AGV4_9RHOB|nr:HAD-IA family hydrolase [Mesobaculum littorinae]RVV97855.1 HAD family hydrolase [Mesobaculum littorinae]